MHQMASERVQIFKIFPGEDAPGLPYGNGPPAHLNTAGLICGAQKAERETRGGGGGTPIYGLYRYVPRDRV